MMHYGADDQSARRRNPIGLGFTADRRRLGRFSFLISRRWLQQIMRAVEVISADRSARIRMCASTLPHQVCQQIQTASKQYKVIQDRYHACIARHGWSLSVAAR